MRRSWQLKSGEEKGIWETRPTPLGSARKDLVLPGLAGAKVECEGVAAVEAGETGRRQGLEGSLVQATEPALILNLRGALSGA